MDVKRQPSVSRRKRRLGYAAVGVVVALLVWLGLGRLGPATRSVEAATLRIGEVERGELVREVRGPGRLVAEESRWLGALTEARVERILAQTGAVVDTESVLMELSNPAVERAALDAELELSAARAGVEDLRVRLESQLLDAQADSAEVEAALREAELQVEAHRQLASEGLLPEIDLRRSEIRVQQLENRHGIERQRLEKRQSSMTSQLGAARARVGQAGALDALRRRELGALQVRAPIAGILQDVPVEEGQQVSPGTNLALVARLDKLKAELEVSEVQARDVGVGQRCRIDTRNGVVAGRVAHINPAAQAGTVTVEVALEGELPRGARAQQSVDGTIEIERLDDVLRVERPVRAPEKATLGLFRLSADGDQVERVQVRLGRSSVNEIEVVSGLVEGDRVVLSDMTRYADDERLRLD